jgi:hypothetical protein
LATSFRSTYAYDNVLYLVIGEIIEAVSGETWENFVTNHILEKIGMKNSNAYFSYVNRKENSAVPHAKINGIIKQVRALDSDNINPAGGINSCASDMAKWLLCQLDSGRTVEGSKIFSPNVTRQLWCIVTPRPVADFPKELDYAKQNFSGYALGFGVIDYRGRKIIRHYGGVPGSVSEVSMIPELKLGVVVLTNQESFDACDALTDYFFDHFLGVQPENYIEACKHYAEHTDSINSATESKLMKTRNFISHPSLPLKNYANCYEDKWYGEINIELKEDKLEISFLKTEDLIGYLEHYQYDTFIVKWKNPEIRADAFITFSLNPDGTIERATMKAVSLRTDPSFDFQDLLLKPKIINGH